MDAIDRIYEAAIVPTQWPQALGALAVSIEASQATVQVFSGNSVPLTANYNQPTEDIKIFQRCWSDSAAVQWGLRQCPTHFASFLDHFAPEALSRDPAIVLLYERGLTDFVVSVHPLDPDRKLGFMFARKKENGQFKRGDKAALNTMRPHLVRAGLISARLGRERARTMAATLEGIGMAAAVLDSAGRVIANNPSFGTLSDILVPTAFGGIALANKTLNARLRDLLAITAKGIGNQAFTMAATAHHETRPPMLIHLLPVRGQANDIFCGGQVLMVLVKVARKGAPAPELLNGLFDLTPAEARLVCEMADGGSLPDIATRLGRSVHTLRAQFRSVAAKTGVRTQAELAQLMMGSLTATKLSG